MLLSAVEKAKQGKGDATFWAFRAREGTLEERPRK